MPRRRIPHPPLEIPSDSKQFGHLLDAYLERLGLTQSELAGRIDVEASTISRWHTGKGQPTWENIQRLKWLADSMDKPAKLFFHPSRIYRRVFEIKLQHRRGALARVLDRISEYDGNVHSMQAELDMNSEFGLIEMSVVFTRLPVEVVAELEKLDVVARLRVGDPESESD